MICWRLSVPAGSIRCLACNVGMAGTEAIRVGCVQMRSGIDRGRNIADAASLIREAAARGAVFVATPEMTSAVDRDAARLRRSLDHQGTDLEIDAFGALARELAITLLIGSVAHLRPDGKVANRSLLFAPDGSLAVVYDKLHMFDVALANGETWRESAVYEGGDRAVLAATPIGPTGLTICYDVRFPVLYRRLAQAGAIGFCVPAAFTRQTGEAHWSILLRARAIETGAFVLAPAQGGRHEDGRETYGHSMIIDPWGRVLGELDHDAPGVLVTDVDPAESAAARGRIPSLGVDLAPAIDIFRP